MRPLKLAAIATGTIGALLIGFLVIGFLMPAEWEAEYAAEIEASPERVFAHLASAAAWEEWTPSPDSGVEVFGPEEGEGSGRRWDDTGYGQGEFVITRSDPPRMLEYRVEVEGGSIVIEGRMTLEAVGSGTRVHWTESGDFGRNPLLGYMAGQMGELQGAQLEASLASLRRLVEAGVLLEEGPDDDG